MFGVLRVQKARLEPEQRETYRALYCTGCHALADFAGRPAALLTSYDQVVLTALLWELAPGPRDRRPARCTGLPVRKIQKVELGPGARDYLAAATLALVGAKLDDDHEDGLGLAQRTARALLRRKIRRARRRLAAQGFDEALFDRVLAAQRVLERRAPVALRELAEPSAQLVGALLGHAAVVGASPERAAALAAFGRALGRLVYWTDALRDRESDVRSGNFNAVLHSREGNGGEALATLGVLVQEEEAEALRALNGAGLVSTRAILAAVVATLAARARRELRAADPHPSRHRAAGDCDVCCAAEGCGECGACEGGCCAGSEAAAGEAATGAACEACAWGSDLLCCCWPGASDRRERRRSRRRRSGSDPSQGPGNG